jgi:DNA-binding MarR family transcriptional regulator
METSRSSSVHAAIACLQRLTDAFQQRRMQLAQSVGLTEQQWAVLEQVSSEHFMPSMFARSRDSSAAAVSKILRQLVDKQLVLAHVDANDARQRRYALTPQGKLKMAALRRQRELAIKAVWAPLGGNELQAFTVFGTRLIERLEKYSRAARKVPSD